MNKYKVLAYAQGGSTAFIWSFGSYWTEQYIPYKALLTAQAITGIVYATTAVNASDEYYANMTNAYFGTSVYTAMGKILVSGASCAGYFETREISISQQQHTSGDVVGHYTSVNGGPLIFTPITDLRSVAAKAFEVNSYFLKGSVYSLLDFVQALSLPIVSGAVRVFTNSLYNQDETTIVLTGENIEITDNITI